MSAPREPIVFLLADDDMDDDMWVREEPIENLSANGPRLVRGGKALPAYVCRRGINDPGVRPCMGKPVTFRAPADLLGRLGRYGWEIGRLPAEQSGAV